MSHTVIALFKNRIDAQQAISVLKGKGVSEKAIDLSTAEGSSTDTTHEADSHSRHWESERPQTGLVDRISLFFNELFEVGQAAEYRTFLDEARESDAIVTVHAADDTEARAVQDVLEASGSMDVYEKEGHPPDGAKTFKPGTQREEHFPVKTRIFAGEARENTLLRSTHSNPPKK